MNGTVEVIVVDREFNNEIIVATFQKQISLLDKFPEDLAKELFGFLSKKPGKLIGEPRERFRDMNFLPALQNKRPYKMVVKKVELE